MSQAIRVLIVDDHTIVRKGIRALLAEIEGIEVVGEADNGQEAVAQVDDMTFAPGLIQHFKHALFDYCIGRHQDMRVQIALDRLVLPQPFPHL